MIGVSGNSGSRDTLPFLMKMGNYLLCVYFKSLYFPVLFLPGVMLLQGTETLSARRRIWSLFTKYQGTISLSLNCSLRFESAVQYIKPFATMKKQTVHDSGN